MIREIQKTELTPALFVDFYRHQLVTKCWRKINGSWLIIDNPFTEDWGEKDFVLLAECLRNTIAAGGVVFGAMIDKKLKGFASVENSFFGSKLQYLELSSIHVSEDCRGSGLGRRLMNCAKTWAKAQGAEKLYISAHSSVESQAFYKAMRCIEAEEYSQFHVEKEPCDCQLEVVV